MVRVNKATIRAVMSKLGKAGAKARNSKMTAAQRKESARRAVKARWARARAEAVAR